MTVTCTGSAAAQAVEPGAVNAWEEALAATTSKQLTKDRVAFVIDHVARYDQDGCRGIVRVETHRTTTTVTLGWRFDTSPCPVLFAKVTLTATWPVEVHDRRSRAFPRISLDALEHRAQNPRRPR